MRTRCKLAGRTEAVDLPKLRVLPFTMSLTEPSPNCSLILSSDTHCLTTVIIHTQYSACVCVCPTGPPPPELTHPVWSPGAALSLAPGNKKNMTEINYTDIVKTVQYKPLLDLQSTTKTLQQLQWQPPGGSSDPHLLATSRQQQLQRSHLRLPEGGIPSAPPQRLQPHRLQCAP